MDLALAADAAASAADGGALTASVWYVAPMNRPHRPDLEALRARGGYAAAKAAPAVEERAGGGKGRNLVLPIVLLVAGLGGRIVQGVVAAGPTGVALAGMEAVFATGAAVAGVWLATTFFDDDFGDIGPAVLKACGIALVAAALGAIFGDLDPQPQSVRGQIVGVHVVVLVWFFGVVALFRCDLLEALGTAVVAAVFQLAALAILVWTAGGGEAARALVLN